MSSVTFQDLDTIDARINDTAEALRQRRLELSRRTANIMVDKALSDLENTLAGLWAEKRAIVAALEHSRALQTIPVERTCGYPGCQQRATRHGFCKAHRNPKLGEPMRTRFSAAEDQMITEMHQDGKSSYQIARSIGRHSSSVRHRLRTINSYRNGQGAA